MFLRATGNQHEGFAWLGLGMCAMCIAASIAFIVDCVNRKHMYVSIKDYGIVYAFIIIGSVVMAASPVITLGDITLFELPVPKIIEKLWSYFRSTGRLVWPAYYLIYIFGIVGTAKLMQNRNKTMIGVGNAIVILCVCIQIYDMSDVLLEKNSRFNQNVEYTSPLSSEIWEKLAARSEYKHIVYAVHGLESTDNLITFGEYASEAGMTINNFYFARDIDVSWADSDCLQEDTIYLFPVDSEGLEEWELHFYEADGYIVGTVNSIEGFYER